MHELEQQEELVRTHYNKVSKQWGELYVPEVTFANYNFLIRKQHVLDLFTKRSGRYLDAGCGTGDFLPDLVERGGDVFAIDFADEMIERSRRKVEESGCGGRVRFDVGDVYSLPYDTNYFDAIIGVGLVEYLSDPDRAFREMCRVMKPGGILIVTVPNIMSPFMAYETVVPKVKGVVKSALAAVGLRNPERAYFQRHYVPWQLDWQLRRAGFKKADFSFCTYGFSNSERMEAFSLGLSRKFDRFERAPLGLLGTNYIVKVEKRQTH
ncbi:MAG TPA: class I SAM-dependent methyltransferase [Vicinamibacterales bacterium]|nr:class I SAM-dependent methyltransferase [Vicinamibacterales bacterium]